jgi:hypothetical protein
MANIEYKIHKEYEDDLSFEQQFKDDPETVKWIRRQLEVEHNEWAWCRVTVEAKYKDYVGRAYLGGCSYRSLDDFLVGGYADDLKIEATDDLSSTLHALVRHGKDAEAALAELNQEDVV